LILPILPAEQLQGTPDNRVFTNGYYGAGSRAEPAATLGTRTGNALTPNHTG
jgi:hypothetical protein